MSASIPPGTQWLRQQTAKKQKRVELEDRFTPEQNYQRNMQWARQGNYWTKLPPDQEAQFRQWVKQNNVDFDPDEDKPDYDMRGFWQALQRGDPRATTGVNKNDKQIHYDDYWKTPYDASFSSGSQWAIQGKAPSWVDNRKLVLPNGRVMYDDQTGEWFGTGQEPGG
jgi:hypothetical protein